MAKKTVSVLSLTNFTVPTIKLGQKIKGIILKKTDS